MAYDSRTELVGIVARHADDCSVRAGEPCRCGPLGYRGGVWDWASDTWRLGPVLRTAEEARDWQRAAHGLAGPNAGAVPSRGADRGVTQSEQLCWWAFCYVGLGLGGAALALALAALLR